ncbi:MAG TPA: nitronate monooxygenase family protein [Usitatibacteraceae bacterium]|jgi:nitronate monooxygenase|nr:nitronate monooxygenase family protein [Usitatibacteraceae bacterium]
MENPVKTDLPLLRIRGREALPIVQGGMGVGVSAHRLAGTVAATGAVGTLSSVDLRRHHDDLMAETGKSRDKALIDRANLVALDREIKSALGLAEGRGIVAVNIMRAVSEYAAYVRQACESGIQAIVVGAGLPLDLPDLTTNHPQVAIIPILSDSRGIAVVLKKWIRKNRLPDAIVIEHPGWAGGHLGAAKIEDLHDARFEFERVLEETHKLFDELGIAREKIPLIVAGGIETPERVRQLLASGASAVQLGTAFAVTVEGDAHPTFKKVLAEAKGEDIVEFMSVAGLPARAVKTPWLAKYMEKLPSLERRTKPRAACTLAFDCLQSCGLRDGLAKAGQFCIDLQLAAALKGDLERGLFFRGGGKLPFGDSIRPVRELIDYLLNGRSPQAA